MAEGKEGQRKLTEAFDLYLQVNAEAQPDVLLPEVDEPTVKAAPDVLVQGRIAAMVAGASEAERKPLEARIAARWKEIRAKNDPEELRKFVGMFGSLFTVGQEARLQLAEQLLNDDREESLIDAERQLGLLRARTQDPELAARAVECLARLNTRKGLLEDAAYYYRVLRDRYPDVKATADGKTGADLFNEAATDKRVWASLDDPPRLGSAGHLGVKEERDNYNWNQTYQFTHDGDPLPFYQRYSLGLQFANNSLKLADRTTNEARWKPIEVAGTMFQSIVQGNQNFNPQQIFVGPGGMPQVNTQPPPAPNCSYMTLGHLAVVPVGNVVVGIDLVHGKQVWRKNLLDQVNGPPAGGVPQPNQYSLTVDPRDGSVQIVFQEGWTQHLGRIGPLEGAAVCLQMRDALMAVDPVNGRVLWTRSDVNSSSRLFGDDQHVFVVEMSENGKPASTRVFRTYDGATVGAPDFHQVYEDRIRLVGRDILTADKDHDAVTLRLYDPLSGKDVWKQAFAPKSIVLQGDEGDLAGAIEPDGQVHVVDLATRKEVLTAKSKMDPKFLDKDATYTVLGDALDVYVVPDAAPAAMTKFNTNLMPGTGLRGLNANGMIYAFKRSNGEHHWLFAAANVQLVLDQFEEMPMLLLTGQTQKYVNNGFQPAGPPSTSLIVIEKSHRQAAEGVRPARRGHPLASKLQRRSLLQPGGERPRRQDRVHRAAGPDQHRAGEQQAGALK